MPLRFLTAGNIQVSSSQIVGNIDVIQCFPTDYMARNMLFFIVEVTALLRWL